MAVSSYRVSEHRQQHDKTQHQYRYGVNSLASLQVNGGGGGGGGGPRASAVRAEALSPSGRRLPVDVVEKPDGTYSANFTPTESGTSHTDSLGQVANRCLTPVRQMVKCGPAGCGLRSLAIVGRSH